MTEKLHAIIGPDGTVQQVVVWDGVTPWEPSTSLNLEPCAADVGIGFKYDKGAFAAPVSDEGDKLAPVANGDAKLAFGG